MADYINGTSQNNKVIEKVRTIEKVETIIQPNIDLTQLANTVAQAVIASLPAQVATINGIIAVDGKSKFEFDNSSTLEKLADTMTIQRGDKETNFEELGNVETNEKDQKEVNKTIDLLSGLDD